MVWRWCR